MADSGTTPAALVEIRRRSGIAALLGRAAKTPRGAVGLLLLGTVVALAFLGPWFAAHSPYDFFGAPYQAPDAEFPLGTDNMGRDTLSRLLFGGRTLLTLAICATVCTMVIGTLLGLFAGHARGRADSIVMRLLDVILAFPDRVLVLLCVAVLGTSNLVMVLSIALAFAPGIARVARATTIEVASREFVEYAEALGLSRWRLLTREILPNILTPLMVEAGFRLTWAIGLVAGMNFLGFGVQPPNADWGLMINECREGMLMQPWPVAAPLICIAVFLIGVTLFGDALSRAAGRTISVGGKA
ncbi:ABC transporter permease [Pandoraea cepalis]|nr:ABC transporter permease [Pandoraea cepalis]